MGKVDIVYSKLQERDTDKSTDSTTFLIQWHVCTSDLSPVAHLDQQLWLCQELGPLPPATQECWALDDRPRPPIGQMGMFLLAVLR
jgi:hypothetical protein